jgi:hypothetical protein
MRLGGSPEYLGVSIRPSAPARLLSKMRMETVAALIRYALENQLVR